MFIVAPAGSLINDALSCCPAGRFILKTVGSKGLSLPSLSSGLPTSTFNASAATDAGAGGTARMPGDGSVVAIGAVVGGELDVTGSVGELLGSVRAGGILVPLLDGVSDRLTANKMSINPNPAAAAPKAIPQGVFKIPRSGFWCCGKFRSEWLAALIFVDRLDRDNGTES